MESRKIMKGTNCEEQTNFDFPIVKIQDNRVPDTEEEKKKWNCFKEDFVFDSNLRLSWPSQALKGEDV